MSPSPDSPVGADPGPVTAADALRHDTVFLPAILDTLPLAAAVVDRAGRVAYANLAMEAVTGEAMAAMAGRDLFRELVPELERRGLGARVRSGSGDAEMDAGTPLTLSGGDGDRCFRVRVRPLQATTQTGWLVLAQDCSDAVRERDRRERAERLAAVGELAAGVAHEINNPLASIKSFAQLMVRDATNREQREALELIIAESTRVADIVENLLSFARQQGASGREPVSLSAVAERVLQMQRYALETAGIQVRRDFDAALSPVMGEVGALQQVILNMVVNAEQALAHKTGERLLIIRTREATEGVILAVVDNGPGIPRDLLPHIFERFRTTKPRGTGLGLAISAAIVRDHSGQIWAESDEDRGTAFYVRLPRAAGPPGPAAAPGPPGAVAAAAAAGGAGGAGGTAAPEAAAEHPSPETGAMRPLRVLVADDEPALRLAISLFLSRRGHAVVQAADAHEALRLARQQPFDVALVDARMPGDGLDLIERLERIPELHGRTALMTGDLGRPRTRQSIATGRPYLTKPFDMDRMTELLETLGR